MKRNYIIEFFDRFDDIHDIYPEMTPEENTFISDYIQSYRYLYDRALNGKWFYPDIDFYDDYFILEPDARLEFCQKWKQYAELTVNDNYRALRKLIRRKNDEKDIEIIDYDYLNIFD
ncbi:MAG: hypothetical protein J5691_02775 [Bacilli bacterium]|nr:hypothetical protein [Bacilli bacterium]